MPDGSSVRPFIPISLKATRDEIDQIVRIGSISCPIAHHYLSFDFNSLNWNVACSDSRKPIAKLIY